MDIDNNIIEFDASTKTYYFWWHGIRYSYKANTKARYYACLIYEDSAIENWKEKIEYIIPFPYFYITHDKDIYYDKNGKPLHTENEIYDENGVLVTNRKVHSHLVICLQNGTTTYNHILELVNLLGKVSKLITLDSVFAYYQYVQHIDDKSKKANKYIYNVNLIHSGNGFDIVDYLYLTNQETNDLIKEISLEIIKNNITTYAQLVMFGLSVSDDYFKVIKGYIPYFKEFIKGSKQYSMLTTTSIEGQGTTKDED